MFKRFNLDSIDPPTLPRGMSQRAKVVLFESLRPMIESPPPDPFTVGDHPFPRIAVDPLVSLRRSPIEESNALNGWTTDTPSEPGEYETWLTNATKDLPKLSIQGIKRKWDGKLWIRLYGAGIFNPAGRRHPSDMRMYWRARYDNAGQRWFRPSTTPPGPGSYRCKWLYRNDPKPDIYYNRWTGNEWLSGNSKPPAPLVAAEINKRTRGTWELLGWAFEEKVS